MFGQRFRNGQWGGVKTPVKSKYYNLFLIFLILFLALMSSSFLVKAEDDFSFGPVCGDLPVLCVEAKEKFSKNDGFVLKNKGCSMIDCHCDNKIYGDVLNLIINNCYKKLELYEKEN